MAETPDAMWCDRTPITKMAPWMCKDPEYVILTPARVDGRDKSMLSWFGVSADMLDAWLRDGTSLDNCINATELLRKHRPPAELEF